MLFLECTNPDLPKITGEIIDEYANFPCEMCLIIIEQVKWESVHIAQKLGALLH